jgi:dihydroorotate dehydrogenase
MSAARLFDWGMQPGLAGGIDKTGSQAPQLLKAGFAAVEFGTVVPAEPGQLPSQAMVLAARLAEAKATLGRAALIGIGLGMCPSAQPASLATDCCNGLWAAWRVADYLSFNLSAKAYRPLLTTQYLPTLRGALQAAADTRRILAERSGRAAALALKLPLAQPATQAIACAATSAGFDALIAVLPDDADRLAHLHELACVLQGGLALIAVGGVRTGMDVRAALAAGANGVQVHRIFAEQWPGCLATLRDEPAPASASS